MGTFDIERTERTLPGRATGVRANIDVSMGGQAVAQQVAGLGGAIMNLGIRWDLINAKTQLSESNVQAAQAIDKFYIELDKNNEPETYTNRLEALYTELDALAPKHRAAASVYNQNLAQRKIKLGLATRELVKKKLRSKAQINDSLLLQTAIESGKLEDFATYKTSIIGNLKLGNVYEAKEADILLRNARREMELSKQRRELAVQEALELQRQADWDMLGKALNDGTINYTMIDNTSLPETGPGSQEIYRKKMLAELDRRARGEVILTNQSIKGDLEAEAYKIWTGAVRKEDYEDSLTNARYGEMVEGKLQYTFGDIVSDKPLIDDGAYDELKTLGLRELKTSQGKGLVEANAYGKEQLVMVADELTFMQKLAKYDEPQQARMQAARQIELENWRQFNRSMKLWQAENPDAVEGDYYTESRRKMPFYRGRPEAEIISGVLPVEKVRIFGPRPPTPEQLRRQNTKEAYEKGKELGYWE